MQAIWWKELHKTEKKEEREVEVEEEEEKEITYTKVAEWNRPVHVDWPESSTLSLSELPWIQLSKLLKIPKKKNVPSIVFTRTNHLPCLEQGSYLRLPLATITEKFTSVRGMGVSGETS